MYYALVKIKDRRNRLISARLSPWQQIEFMPEAGPAISLSLIDFAVSAISRVRRSCPASALFQLFRLPAVHLHKNNGKGARGGGRGGGRWREVAGRMNFVKFLLGKWTRDLV